MENSSQSLLNSNHNNNKNNETDYMGFKIYNDFVIVDSDYSNSRNHDKLLSSSIADYTKNAVTSLTQSILSFKDYLIPSQISINTLKNPIIFGINNSSSQKIEFELDSLIRFTYKNHFYKITNDLSNISFTSDSGWGCAIRSGQMLLGKALMNLNLSSPEFDLNQKYKQTENIKKIRKKIIELLFDNPLEISLNLNQKYEFKTFINYYTKNTSLIENEMKYISLLKKFVSEINQCYKNKNQQYTLSPFGILNILLIGKVLFKKQPGEWYSDVNILGIFTFIQNYIKVLQNVEIIHFKEGYICEETLLKKCFVVDETQNSTNTNVIDKNNTKYVFSKKGIIFVSIRLGVNAVEKCYYNGIKEFFLIRHNIGFVGGRPRKSFYFIGNAEEGLIYLDPHEPHTAPENLMKLSEKLTHYKYKTFVLPFETLSPGLSVGFSFGNLDEYLELIEDLKTYIGRENKIFDVKFIK